MEDTTPDGPVLERFVASRVLSIGSADQSHEGAIGRAFSGFRRGDRIFVAHGVGPELRVYDLGGTLLRRGGREGVGPGEFRQIRWIAPWDPDSVVVLDGVLSRVSVFDRDGTFGRSFQLDPALGGVGEWIGSYGEGFAVGVSRPPDPRSIGPNEPGRDSLVIAFLTKDPSVHGRIIHSTPPIGGRYWLMRETGSAFGLRAIEEGPRSLIAGRPGTIVAARSDVAQIFVWDGGVNADTISLEGLVPGLRTNLLQSRDVPGSVLEHLSPSPTGIWVGLASPEVATLRRWVLLRKDGVPQAELHLPAGFSIWHAEQDWLLGRRIDAAGVEFVELLRLER